MSTLLKYLSPPNSNKLIIASEKDKWTEVTFFLKKLGGAEGLTDSEDQASSKIKEEGNYHNITKTVIAERMGRRGSGLSLKSTFSAKKQGLGVGKKKSSFMLTPKKFRGGEDASPGSGKGERSRLHRTRGNQSIFAKNGPLGIPCYSQGRIERSDSGHSKPEEDSRDSSDDSSDRKSNTSFGRKEIVTNRLTNSPVDLSNFDKERIPTKGTNENTIPYQTFPDNQFNVYNKRSTRRSLTTGHDKNISSLNKLADGK